MPIVKIRLGDEVISIPLEEELYEWCKAYSKEKDLDISVAVKEKCRKQMLRLDALIGKRSSIKKELAQQKKLMRFLLLLAEQEGIKLELGIKVSTSSMLLFFLKLEHRLFPKGYETKIMEERLRRVWELAEAELTEEERENEVLKLHKKGKTYEEISKELEVSKDVIEKYIHPG